ncbi:MAG: isoprenylcysteine carboxylmethyltransferase family protein [Chloroflexota bacterium]
MEILILGGAVSLWAAIHSWLASSRMKELARRKLGDHTVRAYRLAYNVFSVVTLAPIALLMRALPDRPLYSVDMPWALVMLGGQAISALLLILALLQTDTLHFAGISQLLAGKPSSGMVTTGFYGLVRHPLYLFGLLILWLTPHMTVSVLTVYSVLTIYLFVGALLEERRLLQEFGAAYEDYRAHTPMIIPAWGWRSRTRGTSG